MSSLSDLLNFRAGLVKFVKKNFQTELKRSAAEEQAVLAKLLGNPNPEVSKLPEANSEIGISYPKIYSERVWIKFAILSWFMEPYTRFELQEILRRKGGQLQIQNYKSYLNSFDLCCLALFLESNVKRNDLFGNILQPGTREWIQTTSGKKLRVRKPDLVILLLRLPKRPRKKVFRRGYNDHGSLPAADAVARKEADSFDEERLQEIIELRRDMFELTVSNDLLTTKKLWLEIQEGIS